MEFSLPQVSLVGLTFGRPTVVPPVVIAAWSRSTSDATTTELTLDGVAPSASNRLSVPANAMYALDLLVSGRSSTGDAASWRLFAAMKNTAGTTALVGSVATLSSVVDAGASGWSLSVTADNTNDSVKIEVTGAAATAINWTATGTLSLTA